MVTVSPSATRSLMRRILVDHARSRQALKRGGGEARVPLDDVIGVIAGLAAVRGALINELVDLANAINAIT